MDYIYDGTEPEDKDSLDRCVKAAGWLKVGPFGELLVIEKDAR